MAYGSGWAEEDQEIRINERIKYSRRFTTAPLSLLALPLPLSVSYLVSRSLQLFGSFDTVGTVQNDFENDEFRARHSSGAPV